MGRDLLESIDLLCAGENYYPQPVCFKDTFFLYFAMHEQMNIVHLTCKEFTIVKFSTWNLDV